MPSDPNPTVSPEPERPATTTGVPAPEDGPTVAALQARIDELLNDPLDSWIENMYVGGSAAEFESTISWRITRPLRVVRTFQMRVQQLGFGTAVGHSVRYARRRLGRGR